MQQFDRQVVGEIEIGQIVADEALALQPEPFVLFEHRVVQPFALLRNDGAIFDFFFQPIGLDDAAPEQLLAHPFADQRREDGILRELGIDVDDAGGFADGFEHVSILS